MSTVSVPEHLWETLLPLTRLDIEPPELSELLQKHIKPKVEDTSSEIPYDVITGISKWTASEKGSKALREQDLDPKSYMLIPLLAGTTFAPSSKPPPIPPPEPDPSHDRRAIAALLNGMLSVVGVGFAAWWAAGNIYWSNESRVLLALAASITVAATEGILYAIWSDRKEKRQQARRNRLKKRPKPADVETVRGIEEKVDREVNATRRRAYEYDHDENDVSPQS
ncbi:hypothetical protein RhiJN_16984 [Ceratobasidium sp. AG-Ba]|nr:hypothetical protein RhiJN_16984 [Ceratobasidium sp. AG-Ba]